MLFRRICGRRSFNIRRSSALTARPAKKASCGSYRYVSTNGKSKPLTIPPAVAGSFLLLRRCNRLLISDNSSNVFYSFTWFSLWQEDSTIRWSKSTKMYLLTSCILWQNAQDLSNFEVLNLQRNLRNYSFLSDIKPFHVCLELDLAWWVNDKTIARSDLIMRNLRWIRVLTVGLICFNS